LKPGVNEKTFASGSSVCVSSDSVN
jgi:hypothetical protein